MSSPRSDPPAMPLYAQEYPRFPHCDHSVLHAPNECSYCDVHPEWQWLRKSWGIAFTGHEPVPVYEGGPWQLPCPSDAHRGTGQAHTWGGNRPTEVDVPQGETLASRMMYGHVGPASPTSNPPQRRRRWWRHGR